MRYRVDGFLIPCVLCNQDSRTAGVIVMDKSTDIAFIIARLAQRYARIPVVVRTPGREGTGWLWRVMTRMVKGQATIEEIDMLYDVTKEIEAGIPSARSRDAAAWPIQV